jgi:RHS repeat-associated protein
LSNLTSIGGNLGIGDNLSLAQIDGLINLTSIGEYLLIRSNDSLTQIDGLGNLTSIGGSLEISSNPLITQIDGLSNLASIGGYLRVYNNSSLTQIDGLANIDPLSINSTSTNLEDIEILNNPLLSVCDINSICNALSLPNTTTDIQNNGVGCNSEAEVIQSCQPDQDQDGIADALDNCPNTANPNQEDLDQDGIGDACDDDIDGDGVANATDCDPLDANISQPSIWYADNDNDGLGDPNDTQSACTQPAGYVAVAGDNCPNITNPNQEDLDQDGIGDTCDDDIDGDGVANATDCDPLDATIVGPATWYADNDNDGFGDDSISLVQCTQPSGYVAQAGDCNDNDPNLHLGAQYFDFTGNTDFTNSIVSPTIGAATDTYTFEINYFDVYNQMPPFGFPRVIVDYNADGVYNGPLDRTIILTPIDANDTDLTDGKTYTGSITPLEVHQNYEVFVQNFINGCETIFGPFDAPDVLEQPDVEIFASDITFSNNNPDVSSLLIISAEIHNASDFPAENFVVGLDSQVDNSIYPDIVVDYIAPNSSTTVDWPIITPPEDAFIPMQVTIDKTNVIAESNELDNVAVRSYINGDYNLPGSIQVTSNVSPVSAFTNNKYTISGNVVYADLAIPIPNPQVQGAEVSVFVPLLGENFITYTNSSGHFSIAIPDGNYIAPGVYNYSGTVTDFTLNTQFSGVFVVNEPVACNSLDLATSVSFSPSTVLDDGNPTSSVNITITNVGCVDILQSTSLSISPSAGISSLPSSATVPPLQVGESHTLTYDNLVFTGAGTYSVCVEADENDQIAEIDENNNSACGNLNVLPPLPDLKLDFGPTGVLYLCQNGTQDINFGIKNEGNIATQNAFDYEVKVKKDDVVINTFNQTFTGSIGVNAVGNISIPNVYSALGLYTFEVTIDTQDQISELNENNNFGVKSRNVLECKPELLVSSLCNQFVSVSPTDPLDAASVTYSAEIRNVGQIATQNTFTVNFEVHNGSTSSSYPYTFDSALGVNAEVVVSVTAPVAADGSTLTVTVDSNDTIAEQDENNNVRNVSLCHEFSLVPPYFVFGDQFWQDDTFYQFENVVPNIRLNTNYAYIASNVDVKFEVSGPGITGTADLGTTTLNNIGGCLNQYTANMPTSFAFNNAGTYTFTFTVDPDNNYLECNENNNVYTRTVQVESKADMRTLSEYINPSILNPSENEPVTIDVSYDNIGFQNVSDVMKLKVLVDDQELSTISGVPGLLNAENNTVTVPVPFQSGVTGAHVIKVVIDSEDEIDEINEFNNEATRTIVVGDAANLYFEYFVANDMMPNAGDIIQLQVMVGNEGQVDAEAILRFSYFTPDGVEVFIGQMPIDVVAQGTSGYVMDWSVTDPEAILKAEIINSSIQEFNELDNWITFQLGVQDCVFQDCATDDCGDSMPDQTTFDAVTALCTVGIIEGIDDNVVPDAFISKEDIAKILYKGLFGGNAGPDIGAFFPNPFPDLQEDGDLGTYHQYARALSYLDYGDRISVFDRDNRLFNPCQPLKKQFYLKALLETFNVDVSQFGNPNIPDFQTADTAMLPYIAVAAEKGIIENDGTAFFPHNNITRAEAFVYLYRLLSGGNVQIPVAETVNDLQNFFTPINFTAENGNKMPELSDGNFNHYTKSNFNIADRNMSFNFAHGYNSLYSTLHFGFTPIRPLGKAWSHTYNAYIIGDDFCNGDFNYFIKWADGSINNYNSSTGYQTKGVYDQFSISSNTINITKKNQVVFSFTKLNANANIWYLTSITDRNSNATTITYEDAVFPNHKRISSVTAPSGRAYTFSYLANEDLIQSVTDPLQRVITYAYDQGRLVTFTDAKQQQTQYTYADETNEMTKFLLTKVTLPKGNEITNNYDDNNRLTDTRINQEEPTVVNINNGGDYNYDNPQGFTTSSVTVPEANGNTTTITTQKNKLGNTTSMNSETVNATISYPVSGVNITKPENTNINGIQFEYDYDNNGNVTRVDKPYGIFEEYTYTAFNDIATHKDGNGNTTTYTYDANGNLTQVTDALQNQTQISVGAYGLPQSVTNPEGINVSYTYNTYGNVETTTQPLNITAQMHYDAASRLDSITQSGLTTKLEYDNNDNRIKMIDPMQYQTLYGYDANDNLLSITNAQMNVTSLSYDNEDRMISQSFGGFTKTYNYDAVTGELESMVKPSGQTFNYQYDAQGRMISNGDVTNIVYDSRNNVEQITNALGTITFDYDDLNRLIAVIDHNSKTVTYSYDNNSNVTSITYPNGEQVTYTYDALNRMKTVTDWNNQTTEYFYLADGRLDYMSYPNGIQTDYTYDDAGRITGLTHTLAEQVIYSSTMTLDNRGNILSEDVVQTITAPEPSQEGTTPYTYTATNRIQTAGNTSFAFDNDGNTDTEDAIDYNYDINDNLTQVISSGFNAQYQYDGMGNRRVAIRNGVETGYVLDVLGLAKVLADVNSSGATINKYVHGLSMISREAADGTVQYYLGDLRGSTVAIADAQGNITHKYTYSDFGETIAAVEADDNPYQYMGLYGITKEQNNLYFIRARYYNPEIGRFLSEDPIWHANLYAYSNNNPMSNVDINGMYWENKNYAAFEYYTYSKYYESKTQIITGKPVEHTNFFGGDATIIHNTFEQTFTKSKTGGPTLPYYSYTAFQGEGDLGSFTLKGSSGFAIGGKIQNNILTASLSFNAIDLAISNVHATIGNLKISVEGIGVGLGSSLTVGKKTCIDLKLKFGGQICVENNK